jgi:hypothetical protein
MAASKINHMYDALLALRDLTARKTAVTASGANTGFVALHQITSAGSVTSVAGMPGALGDLVGLFGQTPFDVVIMIDSLDHTTGDETYHLKLQSVDANKANPTDFPGGDIVVTAAMVGQPFVVKVDPHTIKLADDDAQFLSLSHVLAGTTPSIAYFAYAAPNSDAS